MIWNNYGQHSQEKLHMVPHATGNLFVPSQRKGKAKLVVNSHLVHVEADFGNGLVTGLSIYHQAMAKTWPTWMLRKRKKVKPKLPCLINHFRLFRRHLGASGQYILNLWPTWPWPLISIISHPPPGPGYLFTANKAIHAHDVTFEAFSLLPPHFQLYTGCL